MVACRLSYTLSYDKSYETWVRERAERIVKVLTEFFVKQEPLDFNYLMQSVYHERLESVSFSAWKSFLAYDLEYFSNFKPSPFILNYLKFVVYALVELDYLIQIPYLYKVINIGTEEEPKWLALFYYKYFVVKLPSVELIESLPSIFDPSSLYLKLVQFFTSEF
jgi:hypothetical protein